MTRQETFGFNDLKYAPFIILIMGLITPLMFFGAKPFKYPLEYLVNVLISTLISTIYYFIITTLAMRIRQRYPNLSQIKKRIQSQLLGAGIIILLVQSLTSTIFFMFDLNKAYERNSPTILQIVLASIFLTLFVMSIFEGVYLFQKYKEAELEREKLQRINLQSQLNTLKNQVNPHFLFNSLNTLTSLIPEDPNLAVEFVQKLSASYRNILTFRDEKLISLEKELAALDSYVFLLKMRFQDKIIIENNIPTSVNEHLIIPLSLQMLIENAVKHNIVSAKKPLLIKLNIIHNYLIVSNNIQIKSQVHNSTKVGLANIKSRYKLVNDTEVRVIETDNTFQVELPLIKLT